MIPYKEKNTKKKNLESTTQLKNSTRLYCVPGKQKI